MANSLTRRVPSAGSLGSQSGSHRSKGPEAPELPDWMMLIKEELKRHEEEKQYYAEKPGRKMFRVRPAMRRLKPDHYDAEHISLGLFDRFPTDSNRTRIERCRLAMASAFLGAMGMNADSWDELCHRVVPRPDEVRDLYYGVKSDYCSLHAVQSVLTLDAIFLSCFFAVNYDAGFAARFPTLKAAHDTVGSISTLPYLFLDLFKVENQVPLCVIREALHILYDRLEVRSSRPDYTHPPGSTWAYQEAGRTLNIICFRVVLSVSHTIPGWDVKEDTEDLRMFPFLKCDHFLDCLYCSQICDRLEVDGDSLKPTLTNTSGVPPQLQPRRTKSRPDGRKVKTWNPFVFLWGPRVEAVYERLGSEDLVVPRHITLPSLTELHKAGIYFEGIRGTIHDVDYQIHSYLKSTLYLPTLTITDATEPLWRNLVAYEDVQSECTQEFTSYLTFMDELIEREEDVVMLKTRRRNPFPVICEDWIASNVVVANIFNNAILENSFLRSNAKWESIRKKINDVYIVDRRQQIIEFKKTYFGKPWLVASVVAATGLLVLTFLQTWYTIFPPS